MKDTAFEKALGAFFFFPPPPLHVLGVAWSKLCVCWWHVKQYLPGNFKIIL